MKSAYEQERRPKEEGTNRAAEFRRVLEEYIADLKAIIESLRRKLH